MNIDDIFDTFITNSKEDLEEATRNVLMKMTKPVCNSESIFHLRGGGRGNQLKKRRTTHTKPKQHLALAELKKNEDVCPEYYNALSTAFEEVIKEDFKKSYDEMNPFEKMLLM
eukprot:10308231-Ditylum_brightwellii.AAC.1